VSPGRTTNGLPVTAYLVLGVLAANDEQLTAGEIKGRAELTVGHFYWSPSVSHVRRELNRLLARGMVNEIGTQAGKRAITLYETTDSGLDALRRWVQHFPGQEQVVIKHPVILKAWLARGEDPERVVDTLDRHLEATRARLDEALWSRQRSRELGISDDPDQRCSFAVLDYAIRGLYAEISNIAQLRDEIASGTSRDPVTRVRRPKGQIRRRAPTS
jgi:DNA-binding PadR family transcriptional regulator